MITLLTHTNYFMMSTTHSPYVLHHIDQYIGNHGNTVTPSLLCVYCCRGKAHEQCPFCLASYLPDYKGTVCTICKVNHYHTITLSLSHHHYYHTVTTITLSLLSHRHYYHTLTLSLSHHHYYHTVTITTITQSLLSHRHHYHTVTITPSLLSHCHYHTITTITLSLQVSEVGRDCIGLRISATQFR